MVAIIKITLGFAAALFAATGRAVDSKIKVTRYADEYCMGPQIDGKDVCTEPHCKSWNHDQVRPTAPPIKLPSSGLRQAVVP